MELLSGEETRDKKRKRPVLVHAQGESARIGQAAATHTVSAFDEERFRRITSSVTSPHWMQR